MEKCDGSLTIENKKKKNMIDELIRRGFDPDPVKKWKANQVKLFMLHIHEGNLSIKNDSRQYFQTSEITIERSENYYDKCL